MNQLVLEQTSLSSCSFSSENLPQHPELLHTLKQHQALWNSQTSKYELPINQVPSLLKALSVLKPKVYVREAPLKEISQTIHHGSQNKREPNGTKDQQRLIILDPEFRRRSYLGTVCSKMSQDSNKLKKCLLVCSQQSTCLWENSLQGKSNITLKNIDYKSLHPEIVWKISDDIKGVQIEFLFYQSLGDVGHLLTKNILAKYDLLACDDSEIWMETQEDINFPADLHHTLKKIIGQFGQQKGILLFFSRLSFEIESILPIGSLLHPQKFCIDPLKGTKNHYNIALWMVPRYRTKRFQKQLYFVLTNTFVVNLPEKYPQITLPTVIHRVKITEDQKARIKAIDSRFKNIDRKGAIASVQNPRNAGTLYSENSNLAEGNYIREIRNSVISQKEGTVFQWIRYWTIFLKHRVAVVVENHKIQDKIEAFLREQGIRCQIYEIKIISNQDPQLEYCPPPTYEAPVLIITRQKITKELKIHLRQKEEMLGLNEQNFHQEGPFKEQKNMCQTLDNQLPRIATYRHMVFVDTFWYDFNFQKEKALSTILEESLMEKNKPKLVKHYFIFNEGSEQKILKRYFENLEDWKKQNAEKMSHIEKQVQNIWKNVLEKHQRNLNSQVIAGVFDIDEQFDRLEFEARKLAQMQKEEKEKPVWNTNIKGLIVEASLPVPYEAGGRIELKEEQGGSKLQDLSWLKEEESNTTNNSDSFEKQAARYLLETEQNRKKSEEISEQQPSSKKIKLHKYESPKKVIRVQRPVLPFVQLGDKTQKQLCQKYKSKQITPKRQTSYGKNTLWNKNPMTKQLRVIRKTMTLKIQLKEGSVLTFPIKNND